MKTRSLFVVVAVVVALIAAPAFAQDGGEGGMAGCKPEGTWYGSNSIGQNYIFTITGVGGGRYMGVANGLPDTSLCAEATSFRGDMVRTGRNTYQIRQILLCDAYGTLMLYAVEGEITLTGCNHFDVVFDNVGIYLWGGDFTPFVDPYDIPFVPPEPPVTGTYDRMPAP